MPCSTTGAPTRGGANFLLADGSVRFLTLQRYFDLTVDFAGRFGFGILGILRVRG
ncbi:H-X9-DG-CTERM domain-containing protein [Gemmata obscuriglobus]|uniref:H-X9-DG-CTERM domain-containing protein n=1 Tax=Gemmata obscuriglobus TaxID=114 RepID=UPI003AAE05D1